MAWVSDWLAWSTAIAVVALPLIRLQTGGLSWGEAFVDQGRDVVMIDMFCIIGGGAIRLLRQREPAVARRPVQNAAEYAGVFGRG